MGKSGLHFRRQVEMAIHTNEWGLRRFVTIRWRIFKGANDVRAGVRIAHAHIHERHPEPDHVRNPGFWFGEVRKVWVILPRSPGTANGRPPRAGFAFFTSGLFPVG